ncbi:hypothetical protein CTI12_AA103780 [Artemisia annua]|uniref:dolichyl-P-Glc:Glc1Man9GlcNAc2-PP-dolichol alpha-1,3-glucosyltransferase n=1 Tax=Artemisia annua TaxID=35608 RepID=A0A2U1PWT1_ARTAN|nr:hypothetical protein CTI12_AA103780 [Artemisia annua]
MKPPKQKEAQRVKEKHTQRQSPNRSVIKDLLWFSGIATFLKVLLIPAYHSTDFEVHRNWLAITHTLPLSHWYTDETSPWTLDYPPFFAYFERFLSVFASLVDPTITDLYNGLNYKAPSVIIFQRLSVIASDTVLLYSLYKLTKNMELKKRFLIWVLVVWSPGLLIVDHLHFQYNGFLLGILLISLGALQKGNDLMGGFVFAVLLCFKHLFAVAGPVYFVYLFRHYCRGGVLRGFAKLVTMGVVVVGVFIAAYGPFAYDGQILQVLRRMFPFGRGLCHAYWAPNFWVFYILSDKLLAFVLRKLGFHIQPPSASFTGGLVGDSSPFAILPTITPSVTFAMVLLAISPCLVKAWRNPQPKMIIRWVAYAYTCGFLFGWHVHEKASLHFLIPLAVVAVESIEDALSIYSLFPLLYEAQEYPIKVVLLLLHVALMWFGFSSKFSETSESDKKTGSISKNGGLVTGWIEKIYLVVSIYSLFPLLYEAQEYPIKVVLLLLHVALMWFGFSSKFSETSESDKKTGSISKNGGLVTGWIEKIYLVGFVVVEVWGQFLHPLILGDRLPFLPLMLISFYSSNGEDVKDEAETQARGESTMPERFRYLTKEAPDPPVRWPYFIGGYLHLAPINRPPRLMFATRGGNRAGLVRSYDAHKGVFVFNDEASFSFCSKEIAEVTGMRDSGISLKEYEEGLSSSPHFPQYLFKLRGELVSGAKGKISANHIRAMLMGMSVGDDEGKLIFKKLMIFYLMEEVLLCEANSSRAVIYNRIREIQHKLTDKNSQESPPIQKYKGQRVKDLDIVLKALKASDIDPCPHCTSCSQDSGSPDSGSSSAVQNAEDAVSVVAEIANLSLAGDVADKDVVKGDHGPKTGPDRPRPYRTEDREPEKP